MSATFLEEYRKSNPFMDYCAIDAVFAAPDASEVQMTIRPESRNVHGVVHGGLIFTMADCVAGLTARGDGRDYVTQSTHLNFIRNLPSGTLHAYGSTVSRGRTVVIVRVRVEGEAGQLLAEGTLDMYCIGQHFGDYRAR